VGTGTLTSVETAHFGSIPVYRRACPLCSRDNDDTGPSGYSNPPWHIKHCPECDFVYLDSAPHHAMQFETMAWERTTRLEEQRRAGLRPLSYRLSKLTRFRVRMLPKRTMLGYITSRIEGGNVLDLGCGAGKALERLPPSYIPFGIEISSESAAIADAAFRARGGYAINAASVEGLKHFADHSFAAACLNSYLEHEAEPLPVLKSLRRVLAASGFVVVKIPNYGSLNRRIMGQRWCGFRYPDHLNYFTPKSLTVMAAEAGFETHFGLTGRLPSSDIMWAVLTQSGALPSGAHNAVRRFRRREAVSESA
jgi:SAM-dependent methyltransferase